MNMYKQNLESQNYLMKSFMTYDFMKFTQFIKASEKIYSTIKTKNRLNENYNNSRRFHKRIYLNRKTRRSKLKLFNTNTKSNTKYSDISSIDYLQDDIKEIKYSQKETEIKLDMIIKHLIKNSEENGEDNKTENKNDYNNLNIDNFSLELQSSTKPIFDYFSFKIKPDMSISILNGNETITEERNSLSGVSLIKKRISPSPDRLLNQKFFEDTNQMFNTKEESTNPFRMTTKTETEVNQLNKKALENIFRSDKKLEEDVRSALDLEKNLAENLENTISINNTSKGIKMMNTFNTDRNNENNEISFIKNFKDDISMTNYSDREIRSEKNIKRININLDNNILIQNFQISEEENIIENIIENNSIINNISNIDNISNISNKQTPIKKMNTCSIEKSNITSENGDSNSQTSFNMESSQEKFKQVRGFNFRNNIKTKKFNKPLINSQCNSTETPFINEYESQNSNISNVFHNLSHSQNLINKSVNLDDKIKVRKFNFNNNLNIRKFIRQDITGNNLVLKEREKQYEIEEIESEPITINDLKSKAE